MTRLGARAWSAATATMFRVSLEGLHLTLRTCAVGLKVARLFLLVFEFTQFLLI